MINNTKNLKLPSNRKFGYFFSIIFLIASAYFYIKEINIAFYAFLILSTVFFIITFFNADILRPLNNLWMKFGLILGMIVSPIVMGIIFFFIFTPIGILMRLFGRDELSIRLKNNSSYWNKRDNNIHSNSFRRQF